MHSHKHIIYFLKCNFIPSYLNIFWLIFFIYVARDQPRAWKTKGGGEVKSLMRCGGTFQVMTAPSGSRYEASLPYFTVRKGIPVTRETELRGTETTPPEVLTKCHLLPPHLKLHLLNWTLTQKMCIKMLIYSWYCNNKISGTTSPSSKVHGEDEKLTFWYCQNDW